VHGETSSDVQAPGGTARQEAFEFALPDVPVHRFMGRPPITIDASATLSEAHELLERHDIHHLLVEHRGRVVGVLSDRDLLRHTSPFVGTLSERTRDRHTLLRRIFQFASYDLITVRDDAPLHEAVALLITHDISCLPVKDAGGEVLGVVTTRDLLRGMLECQLPVDP
jgi:acetoin utilization protein AcuB